MACGGGFQGMDAAGKGSTIRRVTGGLDARSYHVIPVAAPTDEERAQPYLWRFWRNLPRKGRVTIYDRTWYGRVLVERIEGFCSEKDWMRAYAEINDFEEQLARASTVLCKFWMQISREEQLRRFKERERMRFKRFKITPEDWRNRKKWDLYQSAAADMIERTSTAVFCAKNTASSSPPYRQSTSRVKMCLSMMSITCFKILSPAWWPQISLMSLN